MKPFASLLVANLKEFVRDRPALFWMLAFPLIFILLFGAIFSNEDNVSFDIGLVVEDQSPVAQGFAEALKSIDVFKITEGGQAAELGALKDGDRRAVIVVGPGFGASIAAGGTGDVEVYYDPSQTTVVQVLLPILRKVATEFSFAVTQTQPVVALSEKSIQAHNLRYIDFFVPGILAMALMQLGIFSAIPLVIQRQNRILKRLGATPLPRRTVIASSVVFRLILSVVQAAVIILVGWAVFRVEVAGNWLLLAGMVLLGAATFVSIGYLVAAFARTEESAMPLLMVIQFPMMFLGGVFFPVESMPSFLKPVVQAIPLTYLGDSLRQTMVGASALNSHLVNVAVLGGWLVVCLVLSVRFFRWE